VNELPIHASAIAMFAMIARRYPDPPLANACVRTMTAPGTGNWLAAVPSIAMRTARQMLTFCERRRAESVNSMLLRVTTAGGPSNTTSTRSL
jgi:hypothetical protein